jgi:hypothetical protein
VKDSLADLVDGPPPFRCNASNRKGKNMEKRRHQRLAMKKLTVDASDGIGFLQGMVSDVSRSGVSVLGFQRRKSQDPATMTFVVSGLGENFKMTVRPKWSVLQGAGKAVGTEIINPPAHWTEFVIQCEQKSRKY